jgi:hypothetical protein
MYYRAEIQSFKLLTCTESIPTDNPNLKQENQIIQLTFTDFKGTHNTKRAQILHYACLHLIESPTNRSNKLNSDQRTKLKTKYIHFFIRHISKHRYPVRND